MIDTAVRWIIFMILVIFSASLSVIITPIGSLVVLIIIVIWLGEHFPSKN